MPSDVEVVEFTDPGCSWAWGSEPKIRLLRGRYGDRVTWRRVLGGLVENMAVATDGFDPVASVPRWRRYWEKVSRHTGAPWPASLSRMYASTFPACSVAKAAERQGDDAADRVLRRLREATFFFGEPPDDTASIRAALAGIVGVEVDRLLADASSSAVDAAFCADRAETRDPDPYVIGLDDPGEGSGRAKRDGDAHRYVFPTLLVAGPAGRRVVPGWKPLDSYLAALESASPGITESPGVDLSPDAYLARSANRDRDRLRDVLRRRATRGCRGRRPRGWTAVARPARGRGARVRSDAVTDGAPRVWCVGAGAIGGNVAARLVRAGASPLVVDADERHVALLRDPGLSVESPAGDMVTPMDAMSPEAAMARPEGCDLLLLSVRRQVTEEALAPLLSRLAPDGDVVSLQNGLSCETVASLAGQERTIGCAVGFAATYLAPGRVRLDADGPLTIGRLGAALSEAGGTPGDPGRGRAAAVLGEAFPTREVADVRADLWAKMLTNSVTVLGAVGAMLLGEVLAEPHRPLVREVLAEGAAVAAASGVVLPTAFGAPADLVGGRAPGWEAALDAAFDTAAARFGSVRSVTWRDFELGRPTEIEAVTGEIVRRADALAVAAPVNAAVLGMLRSMEAGERCPDPAHLRALGRVVA